jgi:hypothetical protein
MLRLSASISLILALSTPAQGQQTQTRQVEKLPVCQRSREGDAASESQRKIDADALQVALLGGQIHDALSKMQRGEVSASAVKHLRELLRLAATIPADAADATSAGVPTR